MFAFHSRYLVPLEEVDRLLESHRAFIRKLVESKKLVCSGPKIPRTGGFILLNAAGKEEALRLMSGDPYVTNGVAEYELIEFDMRSCAEGLKEIL